ncbi:MAG: ABC-F family ATP-binding cassette domain-containing protein [Anaeroplasmataceae bacterium]
MVITLDNASFKYLDKPILDKVCISFDDVKHVGVVGINGAGKSTLLKILVGIEKLNSGTITKSGNMVISYLEQNPTFKDNITILEAMEGLSTPLHPINEYEIKSILNKFKLFDHNMLTNNLSGGEKKRLALAAVLVKYSDLLILDEPTNHLDNDMILYLEKYLQRFKKGLIMVTHDRYFLERVCNKMIELDNGNIYSYDANYTKFLELKSERLEALAHSEQKWKSLYKHELLWMRRGAQARTTKQKSRIERFKELENMEFSKSQALEITSVETRLGKKLIEIYNGCKAYSSKVLFNDFNFMLGREDIVGIVGDNGAGKSTLFKIIMNEESLDSGEIICGTTLKIGYFSQHLELIDPEITAIDFIKDKSNLIETIEGVITASQLLDRFNFDSNKKYTKVKMLSGGEKRRLQLVSVLMTNPNLLILDEPTNDLDIDTLEVLEDYLLSFKGPVLVVSHDRYFLDKICNRLLAFENGSINEYNMSFSEYLQLDNKVEENTKKEFKKIRVGMSAKEKNELNNLPDEIDAFESKIKDLKKSMEDNYTNYHKLLEINEEIDKLTKELNEKTERYFYLLELKESYK